MRAARVAACRGLIYSQNIILVSSPANMLANILIRIIQVQTLNFKGIKCQHCRAKRCKQIALHKNCNWSKNKVVVIKRHHSRERSRNKENLKDDV